MKDLYLIRHGQTDWNAQGRWQGHTDIPLNAAGQEQARLAGVRIAKWTLDAIYSSDLKRAHATAEAIAAHHPHTVKKDATWRERDVGDWAGLTRADIAKRYPEQWAEMQKGWMNPSGGESAEQVQVRMVDAYNQLVAQHPNDETVLVATHGGSIASLVAYILGIPLEASLRFSAAGNTGISRISFTPRGVRLTLLNDSAHLE